MLALQGNSGPYLQYTVVRANSILSKSKVSIAEYIDTLINNKEAIEWEINSTEKEILRNLYNYFEVVERAASEYALHHICTYLFELAQLFNSYYSQAPIADNPNRMMLTLAVQRVLEHGLGLLGIKTVAKM
jgi:arginyl-tRNA synthetase